MGDRSQIAIKMRNDQCVFLYAHWDGASIYEKLRTALRRRKRWGDPEYLARIIFSELIHSSPSDETGYGIGVEQHDDVEHPIPVLDCDEKRITWIDAPFGTGEMPEPLSFEEFIK